MMLCVAIIVVSYLGIRIVREMLSLGERDGLKYNYRHLSAPSVGRSVYGQLHLSLQKDKCCMQLRPLAN